MINPNEDTEDAMLRFVENFLKTFAKQLEEDMGLPVCKIDYKIGDSAIEKVTISVGYAGPGKLTEKAKTALNKKLQKRFKEQFAITPAIDYWEIEGLCFQHQPMQSVIKLPERIQRSHLVNLLKIANSHQNEKVNITVEAILNTILTADRQLQQHTLINFFLSSLWPGYADALRAHSHLMHLGPCSVATVVSYYVHTQNDAKLVYSQSYALAKHLVTQHPEWEGYFTQTGTFNDYLSSRQDKDFIDELSMLKNNIDSMSQRARRDLAVLQATLNHVLIAGEIMRKVRQICDMMKEKDIVTEIMTVLAPFWTLPFNSPADMYSTFDYQLFCENLVAIIENRRFIRNFLKFAEEAPVLINGKVSAIELQLSFARKERHDSKKKHRLAARNQFLAASALAPTIEPVAPAPPTVVVNTSTTPLTVETKQSARLIAERKENKKAAHQQRNIGKFFNEQDATAAPIITTLHIVDMQEGVTHAIDICPSAAPRAGADYYQILPYKFILANHNPCLTLAPEMRRLLHANHGRGFIGEISRGQTGLKYFKEGRDEFVVLKATEEQRVLCAIKGLHSEILGHDIELIIPVVSFNNHDDYERALQRQHKGAWLRRLVDERVIIEESNELQAAVEVMPRPGG